jgi:hypothetical protein
MVSTRWSFLFFTETLTTLTDEILCIFAVWILHKLDSEVKYVNRRVLGFLVLVLSLLRVLEILVQPCVRKVVERVVRGEDNRGITYIIRKDAYGATLSPDMEVVSLIERKHGWYAARDIELEPCIA